MAQRIRVSAAALLAAGVALAGCGERRAGALLDGPGVAHPNEVVVDGVRGADRAGATSSIWSIFGRDGEAGTQVAVSRPLWNAALDVLSFLPVQSADPFTGTIVTGFGTPPGGGQAYRATVQITGPELDARALNVSLHTRGGVASAESTRAVEDAILTRARQFRTAGRGY